MEAGQWKQLLNEAAQGKAIRTHSGKVQPGDIFIALPGEKVDGADFLPEALERGASWAVIPPFRAEATESDARILDHPDPRQALGELARVRYRTGERCASLIGITGTNGKTTVSYLLEHLLRENGFRVGVMGTISYRWQGHEEQAALTTPDCLTLHETLHRMDQSGAEAICMEVSSHALEQHRLAGISFDAALFLNLTQDHLDYHGDMEAYFQSKSRLFSEHLGKAGRAVVNMDDPYGQRLQREQGIERGFGLSSDCSGLAWCLQGRLLRADREGLRLEMASGEQSWHLQSRLIGAHNASNLLAAQAVGLLMGLRAEQLTALEAFRGVPGRLEWVANSQSLHVFVDYAHTPDALENVLLSLRGLDFGRVFVVFGCGGDRDRKKRPLMGRVVSRHADVAVLTSDNPRHEDPRSIMDDVLPGMDGRARVIEEADRRRAIGLALEELGPDDVLLIAGKGHEDYQQVGDTRLPFSDTAVVQELLL
jgi:UDP-N-acetylmuramoyl-L-alanyl-D-glutamate--2,6-diaminopimelate ligase